VTDTAPAPAVRGPLRGLAAAIDAALPQTQCTRCGYPDCRAYATAIATEPAAINPSPPGGAEGLARLEASSVGSSIPAGSVSSGRPGTPARSRPSGHR
jgi:electron transport complex protein RnfB